MAGQDGVGSVRDARSEISDLLEGRSLPLSPPVCSQVLEQLSLEGIDPEAVFRAAADGSHHARSDSLNQGPRSHGPSSGHGRRDENACEWLVIPAALIRKICNWNIARSRTPAHCRCAARRATGRPILPLAWRGTQQWRLLEQVHDRTDPTPKPIWAGWTTAEQVYWRGEDGLSSAGEETPCEVAGLQQQANRPTGRQTDSEAGSHTLSCRSSWSVARRRDVPDA